MKIRPYLYRACVRAHPGFPIVVYNVPGRTGGDILPETMQRLCVFDVVSNNTDRKSGHVLLGEDDRIWAIDNGLSFHAEFKLRTVIWDFAGDAIPAAIRDDVVRLLDEGLPGSFAGLLDPFERDAVLTRARAVVREGRFPVDHSGRRYPWPLV